MDARRKGISKERRQIRNGENKFFCFIFIFTSLRMKENQIESYLHPSPIVLGYLKICDNKKTIIIKKDKRGKIYDEERE